MCIPATDTTSVSTPTTAGHHSRKSVQPDPRHPKSSLFPWRRMEISCGFPHGRRRHATRQAVGGGKSANNAIFIHLVFLFKTNHHHAPALLSQLCHPRPPDPGQPATSPSPALRPPAAAARAASAHPGSAAAAPRVSYTPSARAASPGDPAAARPRPPPEAPLRSSAALCALPRHPPPPNRPDLLPVRHGRARRSFPLPSPYTYSAAAAAFTSVRHPLEERGHPRGRGHHRHRPPPPPLGPPPAPPRRKDVRSAVPSGSVVAWTPRRRRTASSSLAPPHRSGSSSASCTGAASTCPSDPVPVPQRPVAAHQAMRTPRSRRRSCSLSTPTVRCEAERRGGARRPRRP